MYFFRDRQGLEVDFIVPTAGRRMVLIEAKASQTIRPEDAMPISRLIKSFKGHETSSFVVGRASPDRETAGELVPGVRVIHPELISEALFGIKGKRNQP